MLKILLVKKHPEKYLCFSGFQFRIFRFTSCLIKMIDKPAEEVEEVRDKKQSQKKGPCFGLLSEVEVEKTWAALNDHGFQNVFHDIRASFEDIYHSAYCLIKHDEVAQTSTLHERTKSVFKQYSESVSKFSASHSVISCLMNFIGAASSRCL